ncbi:hypothetical protein D3C76_648090 [compost metagenome]
MFVVGHVSAVGNGNTAGLADFLDHGQGRIGRTAGTVTATAEIIDHNLRAARSQVQRMNAPKAIAGAGDDSDAIIKTNGHHVFLW